MRSKKNFLNWDTNFTISTHKFRGKYTFHHKTNSRFVIWYINHQSCGIVPKSVNNMQLIVLHRMLLILLATLVVYVPDHILAISLEVQSVLSPKNSPLLHQKQQYNPSINSLVSLSDGIGSAPSSHRYNILIYKQYFHSHCSGYISNINGTSYL